MLMEINDGGKKHLLYCPNPSSELCSKVSESKLYEEITRQMINFADNNDFDSIIVDKRSGWGTNRT